MVREDDYFERIASALERIARVMEHRTFGTTIEDVRETSAQLMKDWEAQQRAKGKP